MSGDVAADPAGPQDEERLRRAEAWLLGRELFGIRPGLERMVVLLRALGDPQTAFDAIHVVGSNGKTSTVTMAAALLERRGIRSGAYVSPHLVSFRERVLVAGAPAGPAVFAAAVERVRGAAEALEGLPVGAEGALDGPVTQFEAVTAAAFLVLADSGVRCAVVEAGLGGRWDATNVLPRPDPHVGGPVPPGRTGVTVLTSISLEHTRWLGDTVAAIAGEKVAVLRPGGTLVLAAGLPPAAHDVAEARAVEQGGTLVEATADPGPDVPTPGAAQYQRRNLATAIAAVGAYLAASRVPGAGRDPEAERDVATRVVVPGRFEVVEGPAPGATDAAGGPTVIHDGAHNEAGFLALGDALDAARPSRPLVAVVGVLDDKDPAGMLAALEGRCDVLVLTAPSNPRRLEADGLAAVAAVVLPDRETHVVPGAHDALARARTLAGPRGTVLVTGSLHLVADLRRGPDAAPGARF
ncbi:folylpolyglutamate synthase/dihydrofolate synthase family protein [Patulibacter sp.]|uniref:bifunctional folylpolyglutamate synthase/dihydrofolate synthase n=1 Tax=Patulibacter sp. TaxID=1912859 RepID=UPI002717F6F5|nr:cyanophycin synthetase [Patulibacter sp.]MDO9408437.1 cyanophycin synthetase [Patulibacter sp.]